MTDEIKLRPTSRSPVVAIQSLIQKSTWPNSQAANDRFQDPRRPLRLGSAAALHALSRPCRREVSTARSGGLRAFPSFLAWAAQAL